MSNAEVQRASYGISTDAITDAALAAVEPRPALSWLDIGCGTGDALRKVRDRYAPASLIGVDVLDFLEDEELRREVDHRVGAAEDLLPIEPVDRVLAIEVIEHAEAPWTLLRLAARCVAPSGMLVLTTPNLRTLVDAREFYASSEYIPYAGRVWPESLRARFPRTLSVAYGLAARRPA